MFHCPAEKLDVKL